MGRHDAQMAALREMSANLAVAAPPPPPPPQPASKVEPSPASEDAAVEDVADSSTTTASRDDSPATTKPSKRAVSTKRPSAPVTASASTRSRSFLVSPTAATILVERSRGELASVVVAEAVNATADTFPTRSSGPIPLSSRRAPNTTTVLRRVRMTDAQHDALVGLARKFNVSVSVLVSIALERSAGGAVTETTEPES